jgi:hypothetical protein
LHRAGWHTKGRRIEGCLAIVKAENSPIVDAVQETLLIFRQARGTWDQMAHAVLSSGSISKVIIDCLRQSRVLDSNNAELERCFRAVILAAHDASYCSVKGLCGTTVEGTLKAPREENCGLEFRDGPLVF